MNPAIRNYARLAGQIFAIVTIIRQLRHARHDHDSLRLLDALANALALTTAVLIIVREIREHASETADEAVEKAPL